MGSIPTASTKPRRRGFLTSNDRAAVLFDFGGTLDADGLPWKERMYRLFREEGAVVTPDRFDPAFYAADDALVGTLPATTPFRATVERLAGGVAAALQLAEQRTNTGIVAHLRQVSVEVGHDAELVAPL